MTDPAIPVRAPAGFVPEQALSFGARADAATPVTRGTPLPVESLLAPATSVAITGQATTSGTIGPFTPQLGRPIWLLLSGTWSGSVQVMRSTDGGVTMWPLTYPDGSTKGLLFGNFNGPVGEESVSGATYHLGVTLSSGTLAYNVEQ